MQSLSMSVFAVQNIKCITSMDAQINVTEIRGKPASTETERNCLSPEEKE